jgi:hypothetical protein
MLMIHIRANLKLFRQGLARAHAALKDFANVLHMPTVQSKKTRGRVPHSNPVCLLGLPEDMARMEAHNPLEFLLSEAEDPLPLCILPREGLTARFLTRHAERYPAVVLWLPSQVVIGEF